MWNITYRRFRMFLSSILVFQKNRRTNLVLGIFKFEAYYELQYPRVIWGSHSGAAQDSSLLGCYSVSSGGQLPTFWSVMPLCSRSSNRRWRHPAPSKCQVFASKQGVKFQKPRIFTVSIPLTVQRYCSTAVRTWTKYPPPPAGPVKFQRPTAPTTSSGRRTQKETDVKFILANYNLIVLNNYRNCNGCLVCTPAVFSNSKILSSSSRPTIYIYIYIYI